LTASDRFDLMAEISEIHAAATIICGTQDRLTPPKYAIYMRDQMAQAELHMIEGAGHMVMLEKPQIVSRKLRDFVQGL
jgi:pimeloyl-ACP methyl ester carboxylesterase